MSYRVLIEFSSQSVTVNLVGREISTSFPQALRKLQSLKTLIEIIVPGSQPGVFLKRIAARVFWDGSPATQSGHATEFLVL